MVAQHTVNLPLLKNLFFDRIAFIYSDLNSCKGIQKRIFTGDYTHDICSETKSYHECIQHLELTEHFSSGAQFYEQGKLRNLALIERYLTHWLSWFKSKRAGIALSESFFLGGNRQKITGNMLRDRMWDDITFCSMDEPLGRSTRNK